jgi:trans-aconitate methyltransferase
VDVQTWNRQYRSGYWKFLDGPDETAHYRTIADWIPCGSRVLDVGCGHGRLYELVEERHPLHYDGVDLSEEAITQARRLHGARVRFHLGDFELWEPDGLSHDVIVFNESLSYARVPIEVLERFTRWLAPEGRHIVSLSHYGNHRAIWRSFQRSFETIESRTVSNDRGQRWDVRLLAPMTGRRA